MPNRVLTIVVTGGPCAGKTSAMEAVREGLASADIAAIEVPEAATDLILAGTAPWTCPSMLDFQTQVIALQLKREAAAAAEAAALDDAVIVCDRGICDSHAYLSDADYETALSKNGISEAQALARYDAVFHLESVALADAGAYTKANNGARFEDAQGAVLADRRTLSAWLAHPNLHVIANEEEFQAKANNLASAILALAKGHR